MVFFFFVWLSCGVSSLFFLFFPFSGGGETTNVFVSWGIQKEEAHTLWSIHSLCLLFDSPPRESDLSHERAESRSNFFFPEWKRNPTSNSNRSSSNSNQSLRTTCLSATTLDPTSLPLPKRGGPPAQGWRRRSVALPRRRRLLRLPSPSSLSPNRRRSASSDGTWE